MDPRSPVFKSSALTTLSRYHLIGIMALCYYCCLTYLIESSGIFHFATPAQTELKAKPFTALRERFRLAKDYSSTARIREDSSFTPTLSRHCRLQEDMSSTGSVGSSKVNPNIEELGCPECFNTEEHLDKAEEKIKTALETALTEHGPKQENNKDLKEIITEIAKRRGEQ